MPEWKEAEELLSKVNRFQAGLVMLIIGALAGVYNFVYAEGQLTAEENARRSDHKKLEQEEQSVATLCQELVELKASMARREQLLQKAVNQEQKKLNKPGGK